MLVFSSVGSPSVTGTTVVIPVFSSVGPSPVPVVAVFSSVEAVPSPGTMKYKHD